MNNFPPELFLKPLIVGKDHTISFKHLSKKYKLTAECFKEPDDLAGKTVMIDAGLSVFRGDEKIGNATEVKK